ncbi:Nicotinate-nucleotide adenylyltransferase [Buchnera aphidicola (Thelaxes suberi)]|uniref:nicotinate-nucleotide adenylyltransferase n=1 Tax=Buchnera aphidicola TaxID=9 RepID=UPI0034645F49
MNKLYAILGGTFDPIHYGHILLSKEIIKKLSLKKLFLLPNENPPHKNHIITPILHRINMIKLAILDIPHIEINYTEINQNNNKHYSINTLKKIRKQIGYTLPIALIIGNDNLINFKKWNQWNKILKFSHIIVLQRNNEQVKTIDNEINTFITNNTVKNINFLQQQPQGHIFFFKNTIINISSTKIRKNIKIRKKYSHLIPKSVNDYIKKNKLYINSRFNINNKIIITNNE